MVGKDVVELDVASKNCRSPGLSYVAGSGDYQWPTLDFGLTRSVGTITCDSEVRL